MFGIARIELRLGGTVVRTMLDSRYDSESFAESVAEGLNACRPHSERCHAEYHVVRVS